MSERNCENRKCGNPLVQRTGEDNGQFETRKYCCALCGNEERKMKNADEWELQAIKRAYEAHPVSKRFELSPEMADDLARTEIMTWVRIVNDVPPGGGEMFGPIKTMKPGDPGWDAIAATVTPIEDIPEQHDGPIPYFHS